MNVNNILKVIRGIVRLRGATDNTLVGNISDRLKIDAQLRGADGVNVADVTLEDGKKKLETKAAVTVNVQQGIDPLPDTYFTVTNAGAISDTVRVQIAGTANDSSSPDRDYSAVDVTTTLTANEAGDEQALATLIASDLNADAGFIAAKLVASAITTGKRAIVHISVDDEEFSVSGEFSERPNAGDVAVSVTGTTTVSLAFDTLISRGKDVSLARDPFNPHKLGILGISGTVSSIPGGIGDRFQEFFKTSGGSSNMLVDGSSVPVDFRIEAIADFDIFITQIRIFGGGNGIKFGQFLSKSGAGGLTNGLEFKIKSDDQTTQLVSTLKTTESFKNIFATSGSDFQVHVQAGADQMIAILRPLIPIPIRAISTFSPDDFMQFKIQDNITAGVAQLQAVAQGFRRPS